MAYKTTTNKEFKGKGFIDFDTRKLVSTDKKDAGFEYDLDEVFTKIGGNGDEIQFSVKVTEVVESVDEEDQEAGE